MVSNFNEQKQNFFKKMECDWRFDQHNLLGSIEYVLKTGKLSDCSIEVVSASGQSNIFKAHTFMLRIASPVFEGMFSESLREINPKPIRIDDVEREVFKMLLRFIYTDKIALSNIESAKKLYLAADKFLMVQLSCRCEDYIISNLNDHNVCGLYEFAKEWDVKRLVDRTYNLIQSRIDVVIKSEDFNKFSISTLSAILDMEQFQALDEIEQFKAVQGYYFKKLMSTIKEEKEEQDDAVDAKIEEGEIEPICPVLSELREVIKKIRFLTITAQDFATVAGVSPLFNDGEAFAIYKAICSGNAQLLPKGFTANKDKRCNPLQIEFA